MDNFQAKTLYPLPLKGKTPRLSNKTWGFDRSSTVLVTVMIGFEGAFYGHSEILSLSGAQGC
jgi:hypothetical protein